jgi:hypothetical protein
MTEVLNVHLAEFPSAHRSALTDPNGTESKNATIYICGHTMNFAIVLQ